MVKKKNVYPSNFPKIQHHHSSENYIHERYRTVAMVETTRALFFFTLSFQYQLSLLSKHHQFNICYISCHRHRNVNNARSGERISAELGRIIKALLDTVAHDRP